jgi:heme/copper-type cytochrome/quinol oxidase subunit 1
MRWSLSIAQRIILVVAFGLFLVVAGEVTLSWWQYGRVQFRGWTGYTPLSTTPIARVSLHPWVVIAYWAILIALWAAASLTLLRTSRTTGTE